MATLTLVPPIPARDTPASTGIGHVAEEMFRRGVTPDMLRPHEALAKFIAPLQALYAGRAVP